AAPTGSGKTLAAFLHSLDDLLREGLESGALPDEVRVVYVSPLKALSSDIHRNLTEPRRDIRRLTEAAGLPPVRITAAIRSGDTPQRDRAAMIRTPPHILITTPESLYLLLTAERGREMLRTARAVIVDEIHAVIETRRGAHLALSLERLDHVAGRRLQRIGLSATQRPIEKVAEFLSGGGGPPAAIIDAGHVRGMDLELELPPSPMEAVMPTEVWSEVYDRIAELAREHRSTIVFVNTRRLTERAARYLSERLGEDLVMAHHGSLAKEVRLDAEERLKRGELRVLVATASLELGIDVGHVDLVCQLGSPHRIATLLQRVGRSGHTIAGTPKGRIFPASRDDLVECTALLRGIRAGELDRLIIPREPTDVLAQQIVAETAAADWGEDDLFALVRRAYPYQDLDRNAFDEIVRMLARGISTHRGRRGALVHHDPVNRRIRGRKVARMLAITSGGAIPDLADYRVILEPEGTFIGTVNEDFAVESATGDVFQLGNSSWRVLKLETGVMRVADAQGEPPNIPFWLGEAPARSDEVSDAVARLRADIAERLVRSTEAALDFLTVEIGVPRAAAEQIVAYLAETKRLLGAVPTQDTLILERFFDDGGGMQLVLHAPFGARVNRAWGLALRKKFCQNFDFELQAAATDEGLLLSLGPQHSFPLDDVFRYLNPATLRETLLQAMLDSPIFQTRWRWVAALALTVPRTWNGKRTPPQIQRMMAEDLLSSVFPDATACLEHVAGAREIPDHPLVNQAIRDCFEEAMDLPKLEAIIRRMLAGEMTLIARDTTEPSPLASEIVNARVYQFLDGAPLEERRTQAVYTRRAMEPSSSNDLGALDLAAIERVRDEAWPTADDADELSDALLTSGFILESEALARGSAAWPALFAELTADGRAVVAEVGDRRVWTTGERLPELVAALGADAVTTLNRPAAIPGARTDWTPEEARVELLRTRLDIWGPATVREIAGWLGGPEVGGAELRATEAALLTLEGEGRILRGYFTPDSAELEWCDRRLLARIHRYTLDRLRSEIEPVSARDYMRFLFRWQRVEPEHRAAGPEGLASVIDQLAGFDAAAAAWEADILASRLDGYDPSLLDTLCLSGRVMWGRFRTAGRGSVGPGGGNGRGGSPDRSAGPVRTTPITILPRAALGTWAETPREPVLSAAARVVREVLEERGASFFHDLASASGLLPTQAEGALGELVAAGLATADSFNGIRALLVPENKRPGLSGGKRRRRTTAPYSVEHAGRWSLLRGGSSDDVVEARAKALLNRYGVVFRRLLAREGAAPSWRELVLVYRRLEARGEIRGGRFVAGVAGEQFALPEAVGLLRAVRREDPAGADIVISAADPLNLVGIVTPEDERVPASHRNRILYRNGSPVAALDGGSLRVLRNEDGNSEDELRRTLVRSRVAPALRPYLRPGRSDAGDVRPEPRRRPDRTRSSADTP
ncbi:MAG TPA: DEAD/DEAH box helicase, partial [Longimicrobiaceae bacterium]|nr:DEAD/DEAH box helicase [Longimicrobiaceae bacterium]